MQLFVNERKWKRTVHNLFSLADTFTNHGPVQANMGMKLYYVNDRWSCFNTWNMPMRKVTEAATMALCSSMVKPSKPVMLAGGPSSGTSLVTTVPTIRLNTGNAPTEESNAEGLCTARKNNNKQ